MWLEPDETGYELTDVEAAVLLRAAAKRGIEIEPGRTRFTKAELVACGLVREAFSAAELTASGIVSSKTTSKDAGSVEARHMLGVGSPRPSTIDKWQLPVDLPHHRPVMISFPPGSRMTRRSQPIESEASPGGALRVVLTGSLAFDGVLFGPGEWFFIPNGSDYELASHDQQKTDVLYLFDFVSARNGGRFSFEGASHT